MPSRSCLSPVFHALRSRRVFFFFILIALFLPLSAGGQVVATGNVPNGETLTPVPGGHDYLHFLGETVNPANGSVSIDIQYPIPPGRGFTLPYSSRYNSAGLYRLTETPLQLVTFLPNGQYDVPTATWTESAYTPPPVSCSQSCVPPPPFAQCNYATNFTFTDPSGTSHSLGIGADATVASQYNNPGYTATVCGQGNTVPANAGTASSGGGVGDGVVSAIWSSQTTSVTNVSNWQFCNTCDPQASGPVGAFTVTDSSGITYFFDGTCTYDSIDQVCTDVPYQEEDRNGNLIDSNGDTLERTTFGASPNGRIIGGITYPTPSCTGTCPAATSVSYTPPSQYVQSSAWGEVINCPQNTPGFMNVTGTQRAWGGIGLPDGTQYTFYFGQFNPNDSSIVNTYGLINEIIFPGGGWIKYTWKMSNADPGNTYTQVSTFSGVGETSHNTLPGCFTRYGAPVLATRTVSNDGVNVAQTQVFHYTTTWPSNWGSSNPSGWNTKTTTVTTTDNVRTKSFTTVYTYGGTAQPGGSPPFSMGGAASQIPIEMSVQYYDWTGALLRTVKKKWFDLFHLSEEDVTLDSGQTSKTTYAYTGGACAGVSCSTQGAPFPIRLQNTSEYDYNGSLIRSTTTNYQTFGLSPYFTPVPQEPSSVVISGTSGKVAETDYLYDKTTPSTPPNGVIQHDPNYGSGFNTRGNLTNKTQECYAGTGCAGDAISTYAYDIAGQITSTTAPCGNGSCSSDIAGGASFTTSYFYKDQGTNAPGNSDAYVTQITYPVTNGVPHGESFYYNYTFGDLTSSIDQNGLKTGYQYDPLLDRLSETDAPDGGVTHITYNGESSITTSQLITSGVSKTTVSSMDGMFHVTKTQITSDSPCVDTTDTSYDGEGKVLERSNPHCQSDSVYWTQYAYDPLGRTTSTLESDNSTAGSTYSGNSVVATDEAANQRRSYTDAFGRLIEVDEPGPTLVPATVSSGSVTITGSLQTKQVVTQYAASGSVVISVDGGPDQSESINPCNGYGNCPQTIWDSGTLSITVNGLTSTVSYGQSDSVATLGPALASGLNGSMLTASGGSSGTISIAANATGASTNYSFSTSATWMNSTCPNGNPCFGGPSFYFTPVSGVLTGGRDELYTPLYDQGTTTITINGQAVSYSWSGYSTTTASIASGLASVVNSSSSYATASSSGSTISLTSRVAGASVNYSLSSSSTYDSTNFSSPSFGTSDSGGNMTGGTDEHYLGSGSDSLSTPVITLYGYDALNNLVCVVQNTGTSTFVPTLANCQTSTPSVRPRWFQYDSLSHLVSSHNPETGNIVYSYDLNGNLASKTDARSITTKYYYDPLNRLTQKTYQNDPSNTTAVEYGYDGVAGAVNCPPAALPTYPIDRRTSMCDAAGKESWSYPMTVGLGWQTIDLRTTHGVTKTITTQDNLDGSTASITYPSGRTINYNPYNGAGRPTQAVDNTDLINYVTNASYTAFGSLSGMTNGGSITVANTYNPRMQPLTLSATNSQAAQILSLTYDFHLGTDNGNVYQIANGRVPNRTQNFSYDPLNRISQVWTSGPNWGETFTIDPWGNLTNRGPYPGKTLYEPLSAPATTNNQLTGYGYDANGNMIQNGGAAYVYDAENHLISAGGVTYTYDGDGTRVMKSNGTLYWGSGPLAESDGSGNLQREYIFFGGKRVARLDVPTKVQHYYFSSHLGSTSVVTNANGTAPFDEDIDYYPYGGEVAGSTENVSQDYKFTGKERDSESGLDNFGARYFGSSLGRFMQADPFTVTPGRIVDPQQFNLYTYVRNNPLRHIDPTGMLIDDSQLNDKDEEKWKKVQEIANQKDQNGKYQHAELHAIVDKLQSDSRTFVLENSKLGAGTAGVFTITNMTADGRDFTRATLQLDFKQIQGISNVTGADLVPGFNKYQGLLDAPIDRLAETLGHEGAHGVFSIQNPAQAVGIQQLLNQRDAAMEGQHYPYPPDVLQKIDTANQALAPTERYAQQVEKIINGELQADKKKQ